MKYQAKLLFLMGTLAISHAAFAEDKRLNICLNSYQSQSANTPRYFNLVVRGATIIEDAKGVELQTSTAWMNQKFMLPQPLKLSVYETTSGQPTFLCATDLNLDEPWINVTVNPDASAANPCEFTFAQTVPDPACFPGPNSAA